MSTRRSFLMQTAAASALAAANVPVTQAVAKDTAAASKTPMKTYRIPHTDVVVSRIAYGCATLVDFNRNPLSADTIAKAARVINTAYDKGITFFDLADHYGFFKSEAAFGEVLKQSPALRDKIVIQSKCGVRFRDDWQSGFPSYFFDCSHEHIVNSVDGSLRRLGTDHLDILLLHYPDALVEPQEVAKAFDELKNSGKVRYFGVSNHTAGQIEFLKKDIRQPLVVNQIHVGLAHPNVIADGLDGNREDSTRVTGILDYCRLHDINVQAYSPLRGNLLSPQLDATPQVKKAAQVLGDLATQKNTTPWVVALAWLLRHPAGIVPVIGTTNPKHVIENCAADAIILSREEWYTLLFSAASALPP